LDFLGFPWILSSETSSFNGLRWILADRNFSRPFAAAPEPWERRPTILARGKGRIGHGEKVTHFLLFCNKLLSTEIAVRRLPSRPFWPPPPKQLALAAAST
jgi:hypothetical protein